MLQYNWLAGARDIGQALRSESCARTVPQESNMMRSFRHFIPALTVFAAISLNARSLSAQVADTIQALARFLEANGKTAAVLGTTAYRVNVRVRSADGCKVVLAVTITSDGADVGFGGDYTLLLSQLSPEVSTKPWTDGGGNYTVSVENTSGAKDIRIRRKAETDSSSGVGVYVTGEASARRLATLWQRSIELCGGSPRSPAVKTRADSEFARVNERADRLTGRTLPDSLRNHLHQLCRSLVKEQLSAPSTALFPPDSIAMLSVDTDESVMIIGSVEAQNPLGGRTTSRTVCSFEKHGLTYVPKTKAIIIP
jgi:hypothetical protein